MYKGIVWKVECIRDSMGDVWVIVTWPHDGQVVKELVVFFVHCSIQGNALGTHDFTD